ncbi:hypothetical protein ANANG_G00258580 [Anguilla anguilla]|uniref:Uncharacterized protein n=1 Tax=Anguilla anguilla TaxID=7936 RepID=A0A9D3LSZ4_ANGAN|nr:hypothetical protein ANANG_G00258580 [Anguilla anguilla]
MPQLIRGGKTDSGRPTVVAAHKLTDCIYLFIYYFFIFWPSLFSCFSRACHLSNPPSIQGIVVLIFPRPLKKFGIKFACLLVSLKRREREREKILFPVRVHAVSYSSPGFEVLERTAIPMFPCSPWGPRSFRLAAKSASTSSRRRWQEC